MNARPVTHAGSERPDRKKSVLVRVSRRRRPPDAEHGGEVDGHDDVVDGREVGNRSRVHGDQRRRMRDMVNWTARSVVLQSWTSEPEPYRVGSSRPPSIR